MSEGPTIGDWTQYGWIPDEVSSFPARVRLRDSAWMVYYEANVGDERERTEMLELREQNAKLRELCWRMRTYMNGVVEHNGYQIMTTGYTMLGGRIKECDEAMRALGIEVPS